MTDEIRDADGCEDYESLEESGLHDEAEDTAETEETAEPEDVIGDETDDGEPEIVEADPLEQAMQAAIAAMITVIMPSSSRCSPADPAGTPVPAAG